MPPSSQVTVPMQQTAAVAVRSRIPAAPRFIEGLRKESGYIALTIALDVWAACWAVVLAHLWIGELSDNRNVLLYSWTFVPILIVVLATRSLYKRKLNRSFLDEMEPVETAVAVSALAALTIIVLRVPALQEGQQVEAHVRPSDVMIRIWLCAAILVPVVRLMRSVTQRYLRRKYRFGAPALIVGSGPITNQIITRMAQVPDYGLRPVGVLDDTRPTDAELVDVPYLGTVDNFENAVRATGAEDLIIAPSAVPGDQLSRCAQLAQRRGMRVRVVPRLMDVVNGSARIEHLGGVPLMVLTPVDPKGWQFAFKYGLGRTIAALGVLLISPLMIALALAVKLSSPGPIFFRQPRVGRDGKVFDCLKFRSMRPAPAGATFELKAGAAPGGVEGDDRRTKIGKFMRKTSLDELPQLLNVVKGDMTLVGPRPERPEFVELFEMHVRRYGERHRVKAGITGWAQVHGLRGQTSIADRAEFDNYYIENWSLLLDFKILLLTVLAVLRPTEE
ncbi:UDP-phosphate galactose phosphotransferase [Mycobacterium sp. IS-1742]|uniref:sugar transferase n=1 Tax=Mycobacterium sp. IS-1742 TaxID=1772285 RepID=UPI0007402B22|nr:sugar transferase [Mycobacterium sp. IS-1742]KUI27208.1 UDP-phosphate galactose phosphotransferase [Mycobacterium sp. IS-1742]